MQAVIFIGIQATGKSTFYKEQFFDTHVRISMDLLKTRHREMLFLNACLESGQSFVVDNTNPTLEERHRYIAPAQAAGFEIIGYYFESRIKPALQRNEQRQGTQRIPDKGILGTHHRLQLPTLSEGFDKLYYVKINPQDSFVVSEWQDEI